jgi:rhamnogalacturonan endolyase
MANIPDSKRRRAPIRRTPVLIESLEERTLLTFGLTTTSSAYTVDCGAQLVFSISRTAGSGSVGDLTSTLYNGTQLEAPFSVTDRYSHNGSGLSSAATVTATVDPNNQWILITCNDLGSTGTGVIQYYLARKGYNNIYLASYSPGPDAPPAGDVRFITYTNHTILTNAPAASNNTGATGPIESGDVFGHADGTTTSKYYGEYRPIDTQTYGVTGGGYGVFMNIGDRETSSGGPFWKDIDYQTTSTSSTELYDIPFSGHSQTENFRPGLAGFFALEFTTGANPGAPDYTFIDTDGIGSYVTGYTGASGRGTLIGTASGVPSSLQDTVALSNAADEYWALPNTTTGAYTITGVLPGTYTETIYQGELATGTQTVTIAAAQTTKCNITDALYTPTAANTVFRIGTWDGTPLGFLNSNLITNMHPTDVRMSPWATSSTGVANFDVNTDSASTFPMAEWQAETTAAPYLDTDNRLTFALTAAQAATALTMRIGLTRLDEGRPTINVNSGGYVSPAQAETTQPDTRGLTVGNWRGNNCTYSFNIPTTALHAGTNTIDIYCTSGATGTIYSGYQIYDALDLVTTASITNTPAVTTLAITPANPTLPLNGQQIFTAQAYDQFGNPMPSNVTWSTTLGSIDNTGTYVAPATAGSGTITATDGSVTATTNVSAIAGTPPTVATPAAATPNPVAGTATSISVLGAYSAGESTLTYTWSATGPATVTFSANGTNAAKSSIATLTQAGTYTFTATITNSLSLFATSTVTVTVNQTFTSIAPAGTNMAAGTQQLITPLDQFGQAMQTGTFTWLATAGTINSAGLYTAPASGATSATITGTLGTSNPTTTITIVGPLAWYQADQTAGPTLTDSSGNANNGTLTGSYSFGTGVIGNALDLTGGYASLPTGILGATSNFTIAAWIKPTSLSNWMRIFDFGTGTTDYMFLTPDAGTTNALRFSITTSGGAGEQQLNGPTITAGVWTHVAVTLIGNTGTLYVNGVAVATNTAMTLHPSSLGSTSKNYLGKSQFNDPAYQGNIDDFRIFSTGLSAGAIASLYNTTFHTPTVATAAAATPSPVTGSTAVLSVLGSELAGESYLTYTWSATGPAAVAFSTNGTNASKSTTAAFTQTGTYTFTVTMTDSNGGSATSSVAVIVQLPAWVSPTSIATWNFTTGVLSATGATSIIADPGSVEPLVNASGSSAVLTINPSSAGDIHLGGLSLTSGASATVTSLGSARSVANYDLLVIGVAGATVAPTYGIDSTSTLDLADNDMAILYGAGSSPLSTVNAQLLAAYDGGKWNKPGLTSSSAATEGGKTALGFGEASTLGLSTFDGLTLGGNAVLVKYTVAGDTNLDGSVDLADYNTVLAHYNGTGQSWTSGSFDYSGSVGLADYNTILSNYNQTLANFLPSTSAPALTTSLITAIASTAATASASTATATTPKTTTTTAKSSHRKPAAGDRGHS